MRQICRNSHRLKERQKHFYVLLEGALILTFLGFPPPVILTAAQADSLSQRTKIVAVRSLTPIKIDGVLSENIWQRPGDSTFTQRDPDEGKPPTQKSVVWVAYDDAALYFAARLFDTSPDSIISRIGRRDADINSDWFYFAVDSYHDRQNAFYFGVTPGGSIEDGTFYNDSWSDNSWDGVWEVATRVDDKGWIVECRVPYSQLRFQEKAEQVWGVNFLRRIERRKEEDYFVMVPKKESGFVSRFADLVGIRDIKPPARFEIIPYAVSSGKFTKQFEAGDPFNQRRTYSSNLGADVKLGLGSNMTVNATLNPDFGQVEVDPAVVNLSQYETYYEEKRPFFVEGSNFFQFGYGGANSNWGFNWGGPDYFYSRRIGRPPTGSPQHSGYSDIPDRSTILGAAKITGKIAQGWSLGSLHAITAREYATVDDGAGNRYTDVVEPLTSYNVTRSLKEFNDGKQALGFIATATLRDLNKPYLIDDFDRSSYALGADGWTNLDSAQAWVLTGWFSITRVEGSKGRILAVQQSPIHYFQRPDLEHMRIDSEATSLSGFASRFAVNKQKGNWRFNTAVGIISPGFDSNDLGLNFRTDQINAHVVVGYQWYEPDGVFRQKGFNVATYRNYNFGGDKLGEGYYGSGYAQFMNYWNLNSSVFISARSLDDRRTRGGPLMQSPAGYSVNLYASTDYQKTLAFGLGASGYKGESGSYDASLYPEVEWKPSSGVKVRFAPQFFHDLTIAQWVTNVDDPTATNPYGARYVFGRLDQKELSASIRLDLTFTPKLSLQVYVQPLISVGKYSDFKELARARTFTFNKFGDDGSTIALSEGTYTVDPDGEGPAVPFSFSNPDFNFKSLRGNAVLRWEYLPGSTLYLVWQQSRVNLDDAGTFRLGRDLSHLFSCQPENVFLIKASYWWNP